MELYAGGDGDDFLGRTRYVLAGTARDVVVRLAGYMAEGEPGWPPPWPQCLDEGREGLGELVREAGLDAGTYARVVVLARDMVADPQLRRRIALVASALLRCPKLTGEQVRALVE
jgi:hypothetical protein